MIISSFFKALGILRLMLTVAAIFIWTDIAINWAKSARHFGYELWPLLGVLALVFASPIVAVVTFVLAIKRYRKNKISGQIVFWQLSWAAVIFVNFWILFWKMGGFNF